MNIAYKGRFLREGLLQNGHHVHDLAVGPERDLGAALKAAPVPIDLVVWELFGGSSDMQALAPCDQPVVAYCMDTPLNEFWLRGCAKNFDHVFVDQPQCAASFDRPGRPAAWLPLPAQDAYFQPPRKKEFDITFIGTTNAERAKRTHLLRLLQSRFSLTLMSGLSIPETQEVFSRSRVILNENFFPGLTLRVVQGLSAGAAVFTEKSPYGHDFGLRDGEDLVLYDPANILERLSALLENPESTAAIGRRGRERSRELCASATVAARLLAPIEPGRTGRPADDTEWHWNQLTAEVPFVLRFGGSLTPAMRRLEQFAASASERAAEAHMLIGDVEARVKRGDGARAHYRKALERAPGSLANLKLALLDIRQGQPAAAARSLVAYLRHAPDSVVKALARWGAPDAGSPAALLNTIAAIHFALGKRLALGFHKDFPDPVPDTAFEIARMSWERSPTPKALELMLDCLRPYHMQGELLPTLVTAIRTGVLSDSVHLADTARLAFDCYDRDTATAIMAALHQAR